MQDLNLILLDGVDTAAGPQMVMVLAIQPGCPATGDALTALLQRSPDALGFLQCDVRVADEGRQAIYSRLCAFATGSPARRPPSARRDALLELRAQ
ncbi:MAG TPA: hypothetical protein VH702_21190, partial [Vicinamibacterales bacterium]